MLNKRTCPLIILGNLSTPFIEFQIIVQPPRLLGPACLLDFQYFMQPLMQKLEEGKGGTHQVHYKQVSAKIIENFISTLPFYQAHFSLSNLSQSRKSPACPFSRHISTLPFYKIFKNCPPFPLIRACPLIKHLRALTGYPVYTKTQIEICKKFDIRF